MKVKVSPKRLTVILGIVLILLSAIIIFLAQLVAPDSNQMIESIQRIAFPEHASSGLPASLTGKPIRLKIPTLNVDAAFEYVGLTPDGAMGVPKDPPDVAWFALGTRPGENGSAVISGHYGWKNGIPAVFDNLYTLHKGDKLYVEDEQGVITTFVVRELRTYGENEDAESVFNSSDGAAHLNLVTCQGIWNKNKKSYSNRLVVFTDKDD